MGKYDYDEPTKENLINKFNKISRFIDDEASKLPEEYSKIKDYPNFFKIIESLGTINRYPVYILGSQYTHSSHYATNIYCKNLGTSKSIKENISEADWGFSISLAWFILWSSGNQIFSRIYKEKRSFFPDSFGIKAQNIINSILNKNA